MLRISKKRGNKYQDKALGTVFTVEKWGNPYVTLTDGKHSFDITHEKLESDFTKVN